MYFISLYSTAAKVMTAAALLLACPVHGATWTSETPSTLVSGRSLRNFWGTSATNIYAVGGTNTSPGLFYHWNGSAWSEPAASEFSSFTMRAITGFSATEVWVAGRYGNARQSTNSGVSWTNRSTGLSATFTPHGMWGATNTNIWLVGIETSTSIGAAYRWNGSSWAAVSVPSLGTEQLLAVWGTSADNVVMVGTGGYIARWNGASLSTEASGTTASLSGVWGLDANNIFVVGQNATVLRYNGSIWAAFTTTGIPGTYTLNGISGSSASNLYVATGDGTNHLYRWNGTSWANANTTFANSLNAVWTNSTGSKIVAGGTAQLIAGTENVATAPTVTTATQSGVTHNSATLGGNVTADGGDTVSERGIVWGTSASPTTSNNKVQIGSGTGAFSQLVTGLPASTTVHVRAYAINTAGTAYGDNISFATSAAPAPQIAVSFGGNAVEDNAVTTSSANGTDFGSAPVAGVTVDRTFTLTNNGTAELTLGTVTTTGDFSVQTQPASSVAASGGTTSFTIRFDPAAAGPRSGTVSFSTNEAGKNPFNFAVQGTGTGPQTFDLAGNAISNTPFDGGETYIFVTNVAPTDITLTPSSIAENNAANAVVGVLDAVDADLADTHVFELVSGAGAEDNASFEIDGTSLKILVSADFETKSSYSIRVRATDSGAGNLQFIKPLTVTITNLNEVPSFVKGADQLHTAATGSQSVSGWATAIDDGDSTVTQTVSFEITGNTNPSLFSTAPAVSADGTLSYTLSGTTGVATISLRIMDDTSIGGQPALASATQSFTIRNQVAPNYVVTYTDGHLTCTDMSGNGDFFYLYEAAGEPGSVRFFASGRTFSVNGGLNTSNQTAPFATADLNSVTMNAGAGNDSVYIQTNIAGSTLSLPSLTINGGTGDDVVQLVASITFKPDASLNVDLQDDDATPGTDRIIVNTNANLVLSGSGSAVLKASQNIAMSGATVLETENGSIVMEANLQATPSTGGFHGVELVNARAEATGTGSVTLRGRSGDSSSYSKGVGLHSSSKVLAGTGGITLHGSGQNGHTNTGTIGVGIGTNATVVEVRSTGGDVSITGVGGSSEIGVQNNGIRIEAGALVSATGTGKVTLHGTGGNMSGTGGSNLGIWIFGAGTSVSTENGKLTATGLGGGGTGSTFNTGVAITHSAVCATTGTGALEISGTPGGTGGGIGVDAQVPLSTGGGGITLTGTAAPEGGVGVNLTGTVSAAGGSISITGVSTGTGNNLDGIYSTQLISTTGTGTITLHGTASPAGQGSGVYLVNTTNAVQSGGGSISITGIGGSGGTAPFAMGVRSSGRVSGPTSGNSVTIHGTGGANNQNNPHGVSFWGANAHVHTSGGNVNITGIGGTGLQILVGIEFGNGGGINAGTGSVTLRGTGGTSTGLTFGVWMYGNSATELVGTGGIDIIGVGGTGTGDGIVLQGASGVHLTLTTAGTDIALNGTGSTGGGAGVSVVGAIHANGGNISLTGSGKGAGNLIHGVQRATATTTTGTGTITLHGTASPGGHGVGVILNGTGAAVTTGGGSISLTGIGGGVGTLTNSSGVWVNAATVSGPGTGSSLTIHGTGGASTMDYPHGVEVTGTGTGKLLTSGGDIVVTGIGGANNNTQSLGIQFHSGTEISAGGTGSITLNGTGGAAAGNGQSGVLFNNSIVSTNNGPIQVTGAAGGQGGTLGGRGIAKTSGGSITVGGDHDLTLVADSMVLGGNSTINAAGNDVIIRQKTAGTAITLGAQDTVTGSPLVLGLADSELDAFAADEVRIGNADTGAMSVAGAISPLTYPVLWLAKPVVFASSGSFVADITSETVFERMIVDGGIFLQAGSSVTGSVLGGFVPSATAVIPIIQGNDGVTGTFTGLPEGSPVSIINLERKMRLTYAADGGDSIAFYSAPIMVLSGNSVAIAKDDSTPSSADHTDFGGTLTAGSNTVVRHFFILNDGLAPLTGISPAVSAGTPAGAFSITVSPAASLISGSSTHFSVTFDPAANGIQSSSVAVSSDELLDSPYSFAIQGEGTYPEIVVYDGTLLGTQLMDDTGVVDFGDVVRATTSTARLFTIRNIGTGPMSGIAVTKGTSGLPSEFAVDVSGLSTSLLPNTSTTFTVALTPESLGPRAALLEIASTDEDENPFEVHVTGKGVPPEFVVMTEQFMLPTEGMAGGGKIRRPMTGVINQAGFITFTALGEIGTGGVTAANENLLMSDSSGELRVIARKGQMVDVSPWATLAGAFGHFFLTDDGQSVALERIIGADTSRDQAYFASPDGVSLEIISREGDAAPSAGTFKTHTGKPAADFDGRIYFSGDLAGTGIIAKNDSGIYQESSGTLTEILREGDDVTALTGDPAWLGAVGAMVAAAGDGVVFTALLQNHPTDTKQKTDTARNAVVIAGNETALQVIARKGDTVPGTGGAKTRSFSGVSRGAATSHAFLGLLTTGSGVTAANDQVLVAVTSTGSHLVARKGVTQVDGVTLTKFGDFYATSAGAVIFESSGVLCRWTESGGVQALMRIGAVAPGLGAATIANLAKIAVSEGGAIALVTNLSDGRRVLWRALAGAALQSVIVTGESITLEGTLQTIGSLDIDGSGAGTGGGGGGMGSAINDDGFVYVTLSLGNGLHVGKVLP